jgi:prepilin-type N-terminal cleavage/methylation domain-containing protein
MKTQSFPRKSGFTLLETVIAIGVLAVLLTGFMAVFAPAAAGIRRSINVQEADRLTSAFERELVTVRSDQLPDVDTGFEKAFEWIKDSYTLSNATFVYQYRGDVSDLRADGTYAPFENLEGIPGKDYVVQPMVRRIDDALFLEDLKAVEGAIFFVKCRQLVMVKNQMTLGDAGEIKTSATASATGTVTAADADAYNEAVIAFTAEFHSVPAKSAAYLQGSGFQQRFDSTNPVFTRNLAVRR